MKSFKVGIDDGIIILQPTSGGFATACEIEIIAAFVIVNRGRAALPHRRAIRQYRIGCATLQCRGRREIFRGSSKPSARRGALMFSRPIIAFCMPSFADFMNASYQSPSEMAHHDIPRNRQPGLISFCANVPR